MGFGTETCQIEGFGLTGGDGPRILSELQSILSILGPYAGWTRTLYRDDAAWMLMRLSYLAATETGL